MFITHPRQPRASPVLFGGLWSRGAPSALQYDVNRCHGFFNDHIQSGLQEAAACGYTQTLQFPVSPESWGSFESLSDSSQE